MKINPQLTSQFEQLVCDIIDHFPTTQADETVTDLHIRTNADNGLICVTDDNDESIAETTIEGCEEQDEKEFRDLVAKVLNPILARKNKQKAFDSIAIFKPFSFLLEDDEHEIVDELLIVDIDNIVLDDELLKGLDKELDDFLDQLLEED